MAGTLLLSSNLSMAAHAKDITQFPTIKPVTEISVGSPLADVEKIFGQPVYVGKYRLDNDTDYPPGFDFMSFWKSSDCRVYYRNDGEYYQTTKKKTAYREYISINFYDKEVISYSVSYSQRHRPISCRVNL